MGRGQATALQVAVVAACLAALLSLLLHALSPLSKLNPAPLIALKVARIAEEAEGVVGLRLGASVRVAFLANGTVVVEARWGSGRAVVLGKRLVPSSAEGFVIYVIANSTHAWVSASLRRG